MIFRNIHERSYLQKLFIALAIFSSICISGYLMFFEEAKMNSLVQPYNIDGNFVRNVLIISCMCIFFLKHDNAGESTTAGYKPGLIEWALDGPYIVVAANQWSVYRVILERFRVNKSMEGKC